MSSRACLQVLGDLGGDSRLDEFRSQYEKVLQAVRRSHGQLYAQLKAWMRETLMLM